MTKNGCFLLVLVVGMLLVPLSGWTNDLKKIRRAIDKADYEKAFETIHVAIAEQHINPGARYYASMLYFDSTNSFYNLDSASIYAQQAVEDFDSVTQDMLDDLEKVGLNYNIILEHRQQVATRAYRQTAADGSLEAWSVYVDNFSFSDQWARAVVIRDSLAFDLSSRAHTEAAYKDYLSTYPNAMYRKKAQLQYDRLLVQRLFKRRETDSLRVFVRSRTDSDYLSEAHQSLFRLSWLDGKPHTLRQFLEMYSPPDREIYLDLWYYLVKESDNLSLELFNQHPRRDSLLRVYETDLAFWFPVVEEGKIALFNVTGGRTSWYLDELYDDTCDGLERQWVFGRKNDAGVVYALNGNILFNAVEEAHPVAPGVIDLVQNGRRKLMHVAGWELATDYDSVALVGNHYFALWKGAKAALYSPLGVPLTRHRFEKVTAVDRFLVLEDDGVQLATSFTAVIDAFPFQSIPMEEVEDHEYYSGIGILLYREGREALFAADMSPIVDWGAHEIFPDKRNGYLKSEKGYAFINQTGTSPYLNVNEGFIIQRLRTPEWKLTSTLYDWEMLTTDSLKLINRAAVYVTAPTRELVFQNRKVVSVQPEEVPSDLQIQEPYVLLKRSDGLRLISPMGQEVINGPFDQLTPVHDSLFLVKTSGKYGVLDKNGKALVDTAYDFIKEEEGMLSLLKKGELGSLDLTNGVRIPCNYDGEVVRLMKGFYKTRENQRAGLLNAQNEVVVQFDYDDIFYWNDSLVWAKKQDNFDLLGIRDGKSYRQVTLFEPFISGEEEIAIFYGVRGYGLIGDQSGVIAAPDFSDIRLLGTPEKGVIYAEQRLPQAEFYVITFFNLRGKKIHSMAIRNQDYEKLACD